MSLFWCKRGGKNSLQKEPTPRNACLHRLSVRPVKPPYSDREQGTESVSRPVWLRSTPNGSDKSIVLSSRLCQTGAFFALSWRWGVSMFGAVRNFSFARAFAEVSCVGVFGRENASQSMHMSPGRQDGRTCREIGSQNGALSLNSPPRVCVCVPVGKT